MAVIVALGGPDTRAFGTDKVFGAPSTELETSLHLLGHDLRKFAADDHLALFGTSHVLMPNEPKSDAMILEALRKAAVISGHPELANSPIIVYGISGGTMQASGFAARNPERVAALFLKVPAPPERLSDPKALAVPTCMTMAEHDVLSDNVAQVAVFKANRNAGGLWAMAIEPDVPHHSLTPKHRALTITWLRAITRIRLGTSPSNPLRPIQESSGWLGDPVQGIRDWKSYMGDRRSASWLPSKDTAEKWKAFLSKDQP
jgi:pimeloyl-ACP methyl ester carboxylesterase